MNAMEVIPTSAAPADGLVNTLTAEPGPNELIVADAEALLELHPDRAIALLEPMLATSAQRLLSDAAAKSEGEVPISSSTEAEGEDYAVLFERSFYALVKAYIATKRATQMLDMLKRTRAVFPVFPKAKTAKMVRVVVDALGEIPGVEELQISTCKEYVEWAEKEKRSFLRHRIQARLAGLYLSRGESMESLKVIRELQVEIKRIDDKPLLVEVFLLESKAHLALRNAPRAKASLTAARSSANSIYVPAVLQAEIDLHSGVLNATDKDFRTAFSYFFEAFENLSQLNDRVQGKKALKYMLLAKIMQGLHDELAIILNSRTALVFSGDRDLEAMRALNKACKNRSLDELDAVMVQYKAELVDDPLVANHADDLSSRLLETNLLRIVEPYSRVEISRVAALIRLPVERVENKLSMMILDKTLNGVLDQGSDLLVLFDHDEPDSTYASGLETIERMGDVVETLMKRSLKLSSSA